METNKVLTPEKILEYNKRCAEFLGAKINETLERVYIDKMKDDEMLFHNQSVNLQTYEWNGTTNVHYIPFDMLQFHSDWNWIMEVVEAIENLNRKDYLHYNEIKIFRNYIDVSYNMTTKKRYTFSNDYSEQALSQGRLSGIKHFNSKKEAVIEAINEFLIWYRNEQRA